MWSERKRNYEWLLAASFPIGLMLVWQLLVNAQVMSAYAFSDPVSIFGRGAELTMQGDLLFHLAVSLARLGGGMALGCCTGIVVAFAIYLIRSARVVVAPTLTFISNFPPVVWAPLIIAAVGVGELSKIVFIALTAALVMLAATYRGLRSIDGKLIEALSLYRKPIGTRIRYLYLPGAAPYIFEGLKTAIMFGWIALLFAEMMGSQNGLGWLLWDARTFGRSADMMVALLVVGVVGKLSVDAIEVVAKHRSPWYGQNRGQSESRKRYAASPGRERPEIQAAWFERTPAG